MHPAEAQLSNDYLNRHSEALMLIELAPIDEEMSAALEAWQSLSYVAHFQASGLKRADGAIAAYVGLAADQRIAFEKIIAEIDTLIELASFALQPPCRSAAGTMVAGEILPALRTLTARAALFLNSGGREIGRPDMKCHTLQGVIDRLVGPT